MNNFEEYLKTLFSDQMDSDIVTGMKYTLLNPGKRVRSNLFFYALQSFGIQEDFFEIGACIEMIHTYSLIHDDLPAMDNASLRRNKPTLHTIYNDATAILTGDALLTHAFEEITKVKLTADLKIKILKEVILASGNNGMIYGQYLDLKYEKTKADLITLEKIHKHKTGNMIVLPLKLAGIIAQKEEYLEKLELLGFKYGLAFQVKDDLLDVTSAQNLGKDSRDEVHDKTTFPKLIGIEESKRVYQNLIDECFSILAEIPFKNDNLKIYMESLIEREY